MTTRLYRAWQPGNPQNRVFLPNFWIKLLNRASKGPKALPENVLYFEVHPQMTRHDVREYLTKIYELPVRDVNTRVKMGKIEWDSVDTKTRRALWKEDDKKFAYVTMCRGFKHDFPNLFPDDEIEKETSQVERHKELMRNLERNAKAASRDRNDVGTWFGL
uniref:Large ribosomal subunit protein uL23m n=1 Tax=Plectus sambesii TaxID=2011161 RepID=A0A914V1T4_9BILA